MGKHGIKIKNIKAGSLYGYNIGVRNRWEYTNAMFTNSLLMYYLKDNGLKVQKNGSTKDIICLDFDFGSRSYEEEVIHLTSAIENETDEKKSIRMLDILDEVHRKKDLYVKKTVEEIRDLFYQDGVEVEYTTRDKEGIVKKVEVIHYKMLYRSTGKAKEGSCMFINEKLYKKAINFIHMGIKLPKQNAPIVEIGAYASLVASTIVGTVRINPKNILILEDVESFFTTKVISVETDERKMCVSRSIDSYNLKNVLFDGQAIVDEGKFPSWGNGYILLRHHMCKMAGFKGKIQKFFMDYYGEEYLTAKVVDMFGNEHYVKDIEVITTDNAMKWLKFDVSYDYWCDRVYENGCMFGIVKTAHESKLGEVQKMSYQMVNSLDMSIMDSVTKKSRDYIAELKTNDDVFLEYLQMNENFFNDFNVLVALCNQNRDFIRSSYFKERRKKIIASYVSKFKVGKVIQDADNLVIIGSPYAMLLHAVGEDVNKDDTFKSEDGTIQCHTERFSDGEYLACFRSPFNSKNNMGYLHNVHSDKIFKYFDFGSQIIAVNMINTDFQDRNNGSDQDSDSIYTTNQHDIVEYAKYCYTNYPTIVNNIPKETKKYDNTLLNYSIIDNNLASAKSAIGESSNMAQLALTYSYNFKDSKYQDYVCILSVLAQVAIDNAKRKFDVDLDSEIKRIKKDMNIKENGYPIFWKYIKQGFNSERINKRLKCPMNYLCQTRLKECSTQKEELPMSHFFKNFELDGGRRKSRKVEELIKNYSLTLYESNSNKDTEGEDYLLLREDFDKLIEDIRSLYISNGYIGLFSWLINRAFLITPNVVGKQDKISSTINTNRSLLLKVLYEINRESVLKVFSENA